MKLGLFYVRTFLIHPSQCFIANAFAKKRVKKTNEPKQTGFQRESPYQPTRNVSQGTQTSTIGQPDTGMTQQYTPPNVMQETNVYGMQQPNMNVNQPYINPTPQPNIYTVQLPSVETNQPSSNIAKVPPIDQNQQTYTYTEIKEERIEPGLAESNVFERKVNIYPSLDENVSGYIKYDHFAPTDPTYTQSVTEGQSSKEENTRPNFMDFTPKG